MKQNYLILFGIIFMMSSCVLDSWDNRFVVVNHSNRRIFVNYSLDTIPDYPSANYTQMNFDQSIIKGDSTFLTADKPNWPKFVALSKYKKVSLFIFDADLLNHKISLDSLIDKKQYKCIAFTAEQLEELKWRVTIED